MVVVLHALGQELFNLGHRLRNFGFRAELISPRDEIELQGDRFILLDFAGFLIALVQKDIVVVVVGIENDLSNILQPHHLGLPCQGQLGGLHLLLIAKIDRILAIHIGSQDDVLELLYIGVVTRRGDKKVRFLRPKSWRHGILTNRVLTALVTDLLNNFRDTDLVESELLRIDVDTDSKRALTKDVDETNPMNLLNNGIDKSLHIVRDVERVRGSGF